MFFYKILYWLIEFFLGQRISKIEGLGDLPKNRGFIIAANHESGYDPLIITSALKKFVRRYLFSRRKRMYFIANVNLREKIIRYTPLVVALINLWGEKIGYLPANRKGLERAIKLLQEDNVIVIFPEGHINSSQWLRKGKKGVAVMALKSGAPVIPAACFSPPAKNFWQFILNFPKKKKIAFSPALRFVKISQETIDRRPGRLDVAVALIMEKIALACGKKYF